MKTKSTNHTVWVGVFITIGIVILAAAIFLLGGQQQKFIKKITVKAVFNDINGLQAGNNIWLFGVKVGNVKSIQFSGANQVEVTLNLEKEAQSRVHKDALAKISSDGFIGSKIIVLTGGSLNQPQVEDGDYLKNTSAAGTEEMIATLQKNNQNLLEITTNIKEVSKKLLNGEGSLGILLKDPTMAQDMKATMARFKDVSARTQLVMGNLQKFSEGLHKPGTLARELVSDTVVYSKVRATMANLNTTSENLHKASLKVSAVVDSVQAATAALRDPNKPLGLILNDVQSAQNIKHMITNLDSASKKLDDDLEAVQHNFLLRGFFRKREKANKRAAQQLPR